MPRNVPLHTPEDVITNCSIEPVTYLTNESLSASASCSSKYFKFVIHIINTFFFEI